MEHITLFRYVDSYCGNYLTTHLERYSVVRETPCGYWFSYCISAPKKHWRWVSKNSRKRYCYPSKSEAWNSYLIRKSRHLSILKTQINHAQKRWNVLQHMKEPPTEDEVKLAPHGMILDL